MTDEELVRSALEKQYRGEGLTVKEQHAMKRWEKAEWEATCWKVYEAIPKGDYVKMSDRQWKVLNEQAKRYNLTALFGRTVDLRLLLKQFHDFLAIYGKKFQVAMDEEAVMLAGADVKSPAAERYREVKTEQERMKLEQMRESLLPRAEVRAGLQQIAGVIRQAGEQLERRFGAEARSVLEDALDEAEAGVDRLLPEEG